MTLAVRLGHARAVRRAAPSSGSHLFRAYAEDCGRYTKCALYGALSLAHSVRDHRSPTRLLSAEESGRYKNRKSGGYTVMLDRSSRFPRRKARPQQFRRGQRERDSRANNSIYRHSSHCCAEHDREIQVAKARTTRSGQKIALAELRNQTMSSSIAASCL